MFLENWILSQPYLSTPDVISMIPIYIIIYSVEKNIIDISLIFIVSDNQKDLVKIPLSSSKQQIWSRITEAARV